MARLGKTFNDLEKLAQLRNKVTESVLLILSDDPSVEKWSDLKKQTILKMSTNILPRLNEHSGPDGGEIPIPLFGKKGLDVPTDNSNEEDSKAQEED